MFYRIFFRFGFYYWCLDPCKVMLSANYLLFFVFLPESTLQRLKKQSVQQELLPCSLIQFWQAELHINQLTRISQILTAESHLKVRSGIRLQKTTPTIIPKPSATNIAMDAPTKTLIAFWYCATKLMVASWVLSPNSAMKNAMATVASNSKSRRFFILNFLFVSSNGP